MTTSQVNVRLDRKLAERARAAASQRSSSLGGLIAVALERELAEPEPSESVGVVLDAVQADLLALTLTVGRLAEKVASPTAVATRIQLPKPEPRPEAGRAENLPRPTVG
jgi:hypothetical protein